MPYTRRLIAAAIALACYAPLALAPASWAGDGSFAAGQDLPVAEPGGLAAGDFNNDGRPDLAVVSEPTRSVQIFLQQPAGGLAPGQPFAVGQQPRLIAVADFDRDGNDDLAVGDVRDADVKVSLGQGNGTFGGAPDIELGKEPLSLVTGDFNGDRSDDVAVATKNPSGPPHRTFVRLGEGNGKFSGGSDKALDGAAVLAVGDFDSDTTQDLVYGGLPSFPAGVAQGRGAGEFAAAPISLPQEASFRRGWAVGDFNNDSKTDIVAGLARDATAVRLGDGKARFTGTTDVPTPGTPAAVAVGDFNSDGKEDFAVSDTGGSKSVRVRLGDGAGGFTSGPDVPVGASPVDLAVADFDSDGNDDLAVANSDGSVSVRPGTGPAPLAGNLLVNGGFEGSTPSGKIRPPVTITGWELQGGISYARYGGPSLAAIPGRIASPRYNGGGRMLAGGESSATGGITGASQLVDVSAEAQGIDAGRTTANLSAYLGGALQYEDAFTAKAEFVNGNATLGSFQIGPVTAADRNLQTTLIRRAGSSPVPAGTRQIRVTLTSTDADKQQSSALADNAKLTLSTVPAPGPTGNDTPQPRPTTQKGFGAKTLVTLKPRSRRLKAGQPLKVAVRNSNEFTVTGRLGSKRLTAAPRSTTTLKVKLSARQRRTLKRKGRVGVRLTAVVSDPAGQSRRVSRSVRVKSKLR
jgi:hypothetical protein